MCGFQIEYDALVPLGRRALCPGKIIHTNEITCLLGDNWFVECSAEKAIELVNHRITSMHITSPKNQYNKIPYQYNIHGVQFYKSLYFFVELDEQHEGLKKEKELINNWKQEAERQLVETIGEGTVEIREDYDEEYERCWQEQHRESVRRYHHQRAKERLEAKQEKNKENGELWSRLDELEIQEELDNYLEQETVTDIQAENITRVLAQENLPPKRNVKFNNDIGTSVNSSVPENSTSEAKQKTEKVSRINPPQQAGKRVKFSADNIIHNISEDRSFENQESHNNHDKSSVDTVPVGFTDDNTVSTYPCFEPIMIRFRHSSLAEIEEDGDSNTSGTEEEEHKYRLVACPGDIVKVFGPTSVSAISNKPLPKSILKPYSPPLVSERRTKKAQNFKKKPTLSFLDEEDINDNDDGNGETATVSAISKVVTERVPVFTSLQLNTQEAVTDDMENSSKPVSLFKMRRQQQSVEVVPTSD